MKIKVVMFAVAKDIIGEKSVELELPEPATVGDLKKAIVVNYPMLEDIVKRSAFSLDHEYAVDNSRLTANVEVASFHPLAVDSQEQP